MASIKLTNWYSDSKRHCSEGFPLESSQWGGGHSAYIAGEEGISTCSRLSWSQFPALGQFFSISYIKRLSKCPYSKKPLLPWQIPCCAPILTSRIILQKACRYKCLFCTNVCASSRLVSQVKWRLRKIYKKSTWYVRFQSKWNNI